MVWPVVPRYPDVDDAGLPPVPGWELTIDRRPITTIRYPGADRTFASTRLDAPDRWWSAAHTHGTVTLLVVGGRGHPLRPHSDPTAELDDAAQHGALAAGIITVAQQPDDPTTGAAPEPMSWPLYGVTITAGNARFTLNVSSPTDGLLTAMPLHPTK